MPIIHTLSSHESQKIAAGEVVERPANIIKELLENALDAGATEIELHVSHGGKTSIRIKDNGIGMDPIDAKNCFNHHATSKIKSVNDLNAISTFGFRGEALSSIASVSHITLTTKQEVGAEGTHIIMHNGMLQKEISIAATMGTDITVTELFNSVPARKKFLKSKETEWRHVQQLFFATALDYTNVSFKLFSENKLLYNCPKADCLKKRWAQIQHTDTHSYMIPLKSSAESQDFSFTGVISSQQYGRYDRNGIYIFINNRWIKDYKISNALIKGYKNALPTHQYPAACIKITVNPAWVDVNIHPRKEEVQLLHPQKIYTALKMAVHHTLETFIAEKFSRDKSNPALYSHPDHKEPLPTSSNISLSAKQSLPSQQFAPFDFDTFFDASPTFDVGKTQNSTSQNHAKPVCHHEDEIKKQLTTDEKKEDPVFRVIGTLHKTYILVEIDDELVIIDQHAAHERILYEQFKATRNPTTVQLLFPQIISYSKEIIENIKPHLTTLCEHGIQVELFSDTKISIKSTPISLKNASIEAIINECLAVLQKEKSNSLKEVSEIFKKTLHADMACKAAVKAGDTLSHEQITQLITDIQKAPNRFSCPHGRPTTWQLPLEIIKKKFKRDYRS